MNDSPSELDLSERIRRALPGATRWLPGAAPALPADELRSIADEMSRLDDPQTWDRYGEHGPVAVLESTVAQLLGKPAAAMFPSGVMAQQSVLRVWTDRQHSNRIAIPDLSHLLTYELDGPALLNGFRYEHLTAGARTPLAKDLAAIPGSLGAILLELPLRDGGYLLPTFEELTDLAHAARDRGIPVHLDGARLWESQPYLGRSLAEIAALADSVYVSFYKGLGGIAGAVVAGPQDVVDEARQWRRRHGGTLFSMLPYAAAALRGLRTLLPRMGEFRQRAVDLAQALDDRGVRVFPRPPHTNAFRIFLPLHADVVNERLLGLLERDGLALLPPVHGADVPGFSWSEFTVGPATMEWPVDEAADQLARLAERLEG